MLSMSLPHPLNSRKRSGTRREQSRSVVDFDTAQLVADNVSRREGVRPKAGSGRMDRGDGYQSWPAEPLQGKLRSADAVEWVSVRPLCVLQHRA